MSEPEAKTRIVIHVNDERTEASCLIESAEAMSWQTIADKFHAAAALSQIEGAERRAQAH